MEIKCKHCDKKLSKYYLKKHENKCLKKIKNKDISLTCKYCNKDFTSRYSLNRHVSACEKTFCEKCNKKIFNGKCMNCINLIENIKIELKTDYEKLQKEYENLSVKYDNLKYKYETEKAVLEASKNEVKEQYNILLEKISKPNVVYNNTTTNNKITLKNVVSKLPPISYDLTNVLDNLTSKYIDEGMKGFAKFLVDHVCNNKIITTDHSRSTIAYRTNFENFIRDPECLSLINNTLKKNSEQIICRVEERKKHYRKLMEENTDDFEECIIKASRIHELKKLTDDSNNDLNVKDISRILCDHGIKIYNEHIENLTQQS